VSIDSVAGLAPRRAETLASTDTSASADKEQVRARLTQLAAEFESMLLLQMLKEMRKSGSWEDEGEESSGYGAETMLETIDVELASHLSKVQGFGLAKQLLRALDPNVEVSAEAHMSAEAKASAPQPTIVEPALTNVERRLQPARDREPDSIAMPDGDVTSEFGWRRDPINGVAKFHRGIDVRAAYGQDIQAAGAGRVVSAGREGAYGETVVIEHAGGLRTRYAHLSAALVTPGQDVTAGQVVGRAGRSGRATGTHLHFEVTTAAGDRVDPAVFARFKAEGVVADLTGGTSPAAAPSALRRGQLSQERRHDDTN
jgi:murein DD-endopeptidase MepM/ murein hydrolase activator NlpD